MEDFFDLKDKRKFPRISTMNLLSVKVVEPNGTIGKEMPGYTLDFSKEGLRAVLSFSPSIGANLSLKMAIEDKVISFSGVVKWKKEIKKGKYQVGIKVGNIKEDEIKLLSEHFQKMSEFYSPE